MKFNENSIRQIVKEEIQKLLEENDNQEKESKITHLAYLMLQKLREQFEEFLGELEEGEEPSEGFEAMHDAISTAWAVTDKALTGGETRDALPGLFEGNGDCTQEEISNALDVVSRCVMSGKSQRPRSSETELGVVPKKVSAPPEGTVASGVKWVKEGESNE